MVMKADQLGAEHAARVSRRRPPTTRVGASAEVDEEEDSPVGRFEGADVHHHDRICEYVTPEQAKIDQTIFDGTRTLLFANM